MAYCYTVTSFRKRLNTHLFRVHLDSATPCMLLLYVLMYTLIVCCTSSHLMYVGGKKVVVV